MNLAWLELEGGKASCPEIPTGQLGKLLALSFWEDFYSLGPNGGLHSHSILAMCCPCPSQHPVYICAYIQGSLPYRVLFAVLNPIPGYVDLLCDRNTQDLLNLKGLLALNYQLYLVPWEHSQKGQCPTCSSLLVVFCSWAMGGRPLGKC